MRKSIKFLIPTLAVSAVLSACGSSSSKTTSSAAEAQPSTAQAGGGGSNAVVKTSSSSSLGTVLVDQHGMTLYHLSGEQNGKFICTSSACLAVWHPLTSQAGATPSGSVASISTVKRPDGTLQITYRGMPLYTFTQDQEAGQAKGQGIKDVGTWTVVTTGPTTAVSKQSTTGAPAPTTTTTAPSSSGEGSSNGGGRYGY